MSESRYDAAAAAQIEQLLSDLGYALDELDCQPDGLRCIPVVGSAGKSTLALMASAVLRQAGFTVGCFLSGDTLADSVLINGAPADVHDCANLQAVIDRCFAPDERSEATLLACALTLFRQAGCDFVLLELRTAALAQALPDLAAVLVAAVDEPEVQNAKAAAAAFRSGVPVVVVPGQEAVALQQLHTEAETAGVALILPDEADFTPLGHRTARNFMDYGGYRLLLPNLGHHMAQNAAAVIELALALWRSCAVEIEDEAILAGLAEACSPTALRVLCRHPLTLLDSCHTPVQAAALARALQGEQLHAVHAIVALSEQDDPESFFTALESGRLTTQITDKKQMAGMGEPAIDKVYLLRDGSGLPGELPGSVLEQTARYHFDTCICDRFEQALALARAARGDALLICGPAVFAALALRHLRYLEPDADYEPLQPGFELIVPAALSAADEQDEEIEELLRAAAQGEALFDDQFAEPDEMPAQPFAYTDDEADLYPDGEEI